MNLSLIITFISAGWTKIAGKKTHLVTLGASAALWWGVYNHKVEPGSAARDTVVLLLVSTFRSGLAKAVEDLKKMGLTNLANEIAEIGGLDQPKPPTPMPPLPPLPPLPPPPPPHQEPCNVTVTVPVNVTIPQDYEIETKAKRKKKA